MSCSGKTKCYSLLGIGITCIVLGMILVLCWPIIYNYILLSQLSIYTASRGYNMWKETPIPMYLDLYFFNWTNTDEVEKNWLKTPKVQELGPYVFSEHHKRVKLHWNDNGTVSYQQVRTWKFHPELSNGTLDDKITNINVIAATVAYITRHKNYVVKRVIDFVMKEKKETLYVTRTVRELAFEGYDDKLLKLVQDLNVTIINVPFKKFGWFVERNGSDTYDGIFNMYTGVDDFMKTGMINRWNGYENVPYYAGECGEAYGSSGEYWPPVKDNTTVKMFASDMCSSLTLDYASTSEIHGIVGSKFAGTRRAFDNGKYFPEQRCFNDGEPVPTGARNISQCRFGAPAFLTFPHFYLADPSYERRILGVYPNRSLHELYLVVEPNTGVPLDVRARVQVNIYLQRIDGYSLYNKVVPTFMPMFWFAQRATLTNEYASQVKLLLILPSLGMYTGIGIGCIGLLLMLILLVLTFNKSWKGNEGDHLISSGSST